jgi:hypothetical protein
MRGPLQSGCKRLGLDDEDDEDADDDDDDDDDSDDDDDDDDDGDNDDDDDDDDDDGVENLRPWNTCRWGVDVGRSAVGGELALVDEGFILAFAVATEKGGVDKGCTGEGLGLALGLGVGLGQGLVDEDEEGVLVKAGSGRGGT